MKNVKKEMIKLKKLVWASTRGNTYTKRNSHANRNKPTNGRQVVDVDPSKSVG